jgi:molybdopterin synthase catalytic subunit/molybdopterin converting factor small subunit
MVKVRVLAFATAGQLLGGNRDVELQDGARLSDLKRMLEAENPRWQALWPRLAVAVGGKLRQDDAELADGVEVALLPPVSGGAPSGDGLESCLSHAPLDVAATMREVEAPELGAVLVFLGTVRNHHAGRPVEKLTYSAYEVLAEERLATICSELAAASPGVKVAIQHRLGEVPAGEPSVVIAVASAHREEAYETSRLALERLKKEAPIWKLEHYADGTADWREVEPLILAPAGE